MQQTDSGRDFVLLIDDDDGQLSGLTAATEAALKGLAVEVRTWSPSAEDNAAERFKELTTETPLLVVTDYDLTANGRTGLFGFSIVAMAQRDAIPVGDYSRQAGALTDEPDVFEFRLPNRPEEAGPLVGAVALGFREIRDRLNANKNLLKEGSPATMLADLLGEPNAGSAFSLYSSRLTSGNAALIQLLKRPEENHDTVRVRVATYVAGHLLFNSIMRYPGPILHSNALHAYLAASVEDDRDLEALFRDAEYAGPFRSLGRYFWQTRVDDVLDSLAAEHEVDFQNGEEFDQYRRRIVEAALSREVVRHGCQRCSGDRGGYWCPFTERPVCDRDDCSVPSSSWIPEGANLTRVEAEFYEEWAPLVGL